MTYGEGWGCLVRNTCSTVNVTEARQGGFPKKIDVFICSLVEMLHHILLEEERMVSTHRASGVKELLVIVAHVRLALGWEELVDIYLVTQRQHDEDTWRREQREGMSSNHKQPRSLLSNYGCLAP